MLFRAYSLALAAALAAVCSAEPATPHLQNAAAPKLAFGQAPNAAGVWVAHGGKYSLSVQPSGATVSLKNGTRNETLKLSFVGANAKAQLAPTEIQPGRINYLLGNDPKLWVKDTPTYGRLLSTGLYRNTDLVWYGKDGSLEYDLVLRPGADPKAIRLRLDGARHIAATPGDSSLGQRLYQRVPVRPDPSGD